MTYGIFKVTVMVAWELMALPSNHRDGVVDRAVEKNGSAIILCKC